MSAQGHRSLSVGLPLANPSTGGVAEGAEPQRRLDNEHRYQRRVLRCAIYEKCSSRNGDRDLAIERALDLLRFLGLNITELVSSKPHSPVSNDHPSSASAAPLHPKFFFEGADFDCATDGGTTSGAGTSKGGSARHMALCNRSSSTARPLAFAALAANDERCHHHRGEPTSPRRPVILQQSKPRMGFARCRARACPPS